MRIFIQSLHLATICLLIAAETNHYSSDPPIDIINLSGQNFTTYKLDVAGSEPITIIESTTQRRRFYLSPERIQALRDQNRVDLAKQHEPLNGTADDDSHHFTLTPTTGEIDDHNVENHDYEHQAQQQQHQDDEPAKVMMRRRNDGERYPQHHASHIVSRSPPQIMLKASHQLPQSIDDVRATIGLRVTANTAHNSDASSSDKVFVYKSPNDRHHVPNRATSNQSEVEYSPNFLQNFIKDYTAKLKQTELDRSNSVRVNSDSTLSNRRYSWNDNRDSLANDDNNRPNANPFNDKKGWVTLEAVPWSTSKVSRWHAHIDKFGSSSHSNDENEEGAQQYQPSWDEFSQNNQYGPSQAPLNHDSQDDDYVFNNRPQMSSSPRPVIYTTYDPYRPQSNRPNRTKPPPKFNHPENTYADSFDDSAQQRPPAFNQRPHQRPSSPPSAYDYPVNDDDNNNYRDKWYDHGGKKPWNDHLITDTRPSEFPKHPEQRPTTSMRPHHQTQDRYDTTHPDSGNGEWVLISTNKGYQVPSRNGQRAIQIRPSDTPAPGTAGHNNDLISHHSVKLTVLPPLNHTFSFDNRRPTSMVLSHNGMLEVESTFNTVEDSVIQSNRRNSTVVKGIPKRRIFKGFPLKSRVGASSDTSAVIAAVGAGIVPATMAMLMPIVLGRKKRFAMDSVDSKAHQGAIKHTVSAAND